MTNGQPLVVRAAMKPISTLARPLESVNLRTQAAEVGQLTSGATSVPCRPPA